MFFEFTQELLYLQLPSSLRYIRNAVHVQTTCMVIYLWIWSNIQAYFSTYWSLWHMKKATFRFNIKIMFQGGDIKTLYNPLVQCVLLWYLRTNLLQRSYYLRRRKYCHIIMKYQNCIQKLPNLIHVHHFETHSVYCWFHSALKPPNLKEHFHSFIGTHHWLGNILNMDNKEKQKFHEFNIFQQ